MSIFRKNTAVPGTSIVLKRVGKNNKLLQRIWYYRSLYIMLSMPVIYFVIFRYIPMTNIVIAFKDYNIFRGVWGSSWAETAGNLDLFKYFRQVFASPEFGRVLRNTILLNFLDLAFGFLFPVMLAVLLNEIAFRMFKRITQTILYMPHFLSWIIISGMAFQVFAPESGVINIILNRIGLPSIMFLNNQIMWVVTYVMLGIWQSAGYTAIIYLAAITGINPELYEAAEVDGAGRLSKIWHITLPGIRPTIAVMLILNMGRIMQIGFDRPYSLTNPLVRQTADVISTYVYRVGIESQQYSLSTAVGLFQSVICVIFLVAANTIIERLGERGIW